MLQGKTEKEEIGICSKVKNKKKTLEKYFNETKIKNLPDRKFKITVIKILTELGRKMDKHTSIKRKCKKV